MKCSDCGQTENQTFLGPEKGALFAYHCGCCGRLYTGPEPDVAFLNRCLSELPMLSVVPPVVTLKKSGISTLLTFTDRVVCDELRGWLKNWPCKVGPTFEQATEIFAFYVYRRPAIVCGLIVTRGGFTVTTSDCAT